MPKSNTWIVCGELSAAVACASRSKRRSVELRFLLVARAEHLGAHQLDCRVAREQAMFGAPHLAHAAVPELLDQVIAAELLRFVQATAMRWSTLAGTTTTKAHA